MKKQLPAQFSHPVGDRRVAQNWPLVLASASPRRADLLVRAGYRFSVMPSPVREPVRRPSSVPLRLWPACVAGIKAHAVAAKLKSPAMVIGADTIVTVNGRIINKARNRHHAREILLRLSGREHQILTGLALFYAGHCRFATAVSTCRMKKLSRSWLTAYLDSGLWRGKAGAYGIQDDLANGAGGKDPIIRLLHGEWSNVVGLPMNLLAQEMALMKQDIQHKDAKL